MRKQMNNRGFHLILIPLLLVVVAIIGFAGWYVYNSQNKTSKVLDNSTKTTNPTGPVPTLPPNTFDYSGWTTVTSPKGHFSFKYPAGSWQMTWYDYDISEDYSAKTTTTLNGIENQIELVALPAGYVFNFYITSDVSSYAIATMNKYEDGNVTEFTNGVSVWTANMGDNRNCVITELVEDGKFYIGRPGTGYLLGYGTPCTERTGAQNITYEQQIQSDEYGDLLQILASLEWQVLYDN